MGDIGGIPIKDWTLWGVLGIFALAFLTQQVRLTITTILSSQRGKKMSKGNEETESAVDHRTRVEMVKEIHSVIARFLDMHDLMKDNATMLSAVRGSQEKMEADIKEIFVLAREHESRISVLEGKEEGRHPRKE